VQEFEKSLGCGDLALRAGEIEFHDEPAGRRSTRWSAHDAGWSASLRAADFRKE